MATRRRRKCGWFNHNFHKYGKPNDGMQQYRCRRCGRLKSVKVKCHWGHNWKRYGRPRKDGTIQVRCTRCTQVKTITRK